jgi:predicted nucleic-acid-binding Zn-ribbon protein
MAQYAPCPKCQSQDAKEITFTWWGGILGPKMFNHVKCSQCGTTYNSKTGNSNQQAIILYVTVTSIIAIAAILFFRSQQAKSSYSNSLLPAGHQSAQIQR